MEKDNVYINTINAEGTASAEQKCGENSIPQEQKSSTAIGKFKDVNALEKAYGALESAFTKSSQKAKSLEKKVESLEQRIAEQDALLSNSRTSEQFSKETRTGAESEDTKEGNGENREETSVRTDETPTETEGERLYRSVKENREVEERILKDYLASIRAEKIPLMKGGKGVYPVKSQKPSSICDAGNMALTFFKNQTQN